LGSSVKIIVRVTVAKSPNVVTIVSFI
jgi:hypothetical protein